jgi:hypothetical protein
MDIATIRVNGQWVRAVRSVGQVDMECSVVFKTKNTGLKDDGRIWQAHD